MENDIRDILWLIFLVSLPVAVELFSLKLSYILFIILFLFFLMLSPTNVKDAIIQLKNPLAVPGAILILIIVLSIFQSRFIPPNSYIINHSILNYPWIKSISHILLLFLLIIMFYSVLFFIGTKEKLKKIVVQYGTIATILSILSLLIFLIYIFTGVNIHVGTLYAVVDIPNDIPRLVSVEQEPLFLGLYLMTALPLLCSLLFTEKNKKRIIIAIGIVCVTLLFTQSRSVLFGFVCSAIIFFFLYRRECKELIFESIQKVVSSKFLLSAIIFFLIVTTTISILYREEIITFSQPIINQVIIVPIVGAFDSSYGKYSSTQTRLIMYHYALDAFKEHPWLGVGYENYNFYSGQRYYYGLYDYTLNWPEVNNYLLKVLAELGIIGFTCFMFIVISFYYSLVQSIKKAKDIFLKNILKCFFTGSIGIGVIFMFSSSITKPYLWVVLGLGMAAIQLVDKENINDLTQHGDGNENCN